MTIYTQSTRTRIFVDSVVFAVCVLCLLGHVTPFFSLMSFVVLKVTEFLAQQQQKITIEKRQQQTQQKY